MKLKRVFIIFKCVITVSSCMSGLIAEEIWQDHSKKLSIVKIDSMHEKVFKNLQCCYECEFAPITLTSMTVDGDYDQDDLASHWSSQHDLLIFYVDAVPAGFAEINYGSMIEEKQDMHDIGEFYVTPIFRKNGYGKLFAQQIFKYYFGSWQVRQLPELKETARVFWHKVITSLDPENFQETTDHPQWSGYVQSFSIK